MADPDSQHRKIVLGFVWVSSFVFVGKLAGAFKETAVAWKYGVSEVVDTYLYLFNLINWPVSVWFSVLTVVLVPTMTTAKTERREELPLFQEELLGFSLILAIVLGAIGFWGLPYFINQDHTHTFGLSRDQTILMAKTLSFMAPIGVLISLFSAFLMASGKHRNTLFEACPSLTILFFLFWPGLVGSDPLVWGTVCGFGVHLLALSISAKKIDSLPVPRFSVCSGLWNGFWGGVGLIAVGQILMGATTIIDQFFSVKLGSGAVATLGYANRILGLILSVSVLAITRATLPIFSEATSHQRLNVNRLTQNWSGIIFFLGVIVALLGWITSDWIVKTVFQRGAFNADNTRAVATTFRFGLVQIPFYVSGILIYCGNSAQKKYLKNFVAMTVSVAAKVVSLILLVPHFKLQGVQLSTGVMYSFFLISLIFTRGSR